MSFLGCLKVRRKWIVYAQVAEAVQPFLAALQAVESIADAAAKAAPYRKQARAVAACGGVRSRRGRDLKGRCLSFAEREELALAARGATMSAIARRLTRSPGRSRSPSWAVGALAG